MPQNPRNRVTIQVPDNMMSEIERIVSKINARYGLHLKVTDAFRIGAMAFIRGGVWDAVEGDKTHSILSVGDIERALVDSCRAGARKREEA